ncbi:MAG: hypothetical protein ISS01_02340 [Nanoarchaeota archaeon]|nr:hypothetical protein [Nanoarchaeota archaeon]
MEDWKAKIYFVDDLFAKETFLAKGFEDYFKKNGYFLLCEGDANGAYEYIRDNPAYDVLVADFCLENPKVSGLDLIILSKRTRPQANTILVSGYNVPNNEADVFLQKIFTPIELLSKVQYVLGHSSLSSSSE